VLPLLEGRIAAAVGNKAAKDLARSALALERRPYTGAADPSLVSTKVFASLEPRFGMT